MAKASKWDLITKHTIITQSALGTDLGLGQVAQGKTRFITYVKVYCPGMANTIQLGSAAAASTTAISSLKFKQGTNGTYEYPSIPDADKPLFAIDAEGYLGCLGIAGVGDTELTVQYYDTP